MKRDYSDPFYKLWRSQIRQRDNQECKWPNCKSKKRLHVHHINKWAANANLRYDINNGITLCKNHHDMVKNNEDSYIEFFSKLLLNQRIQHD